jgi:hypothetical protein
MRIVDQGLLEWVKERVEESGPQGYAHDYELFDMKGKCLQKWHGTHRHDPHQLAIWIHNVAWYHGDDQYKVMLDRSAQKEEYFKSYHLKISREQDLFSDTVHDMGLVQLYKWYDALAHRFTLEKVELHQAHALVAWEMNPKKEQYKRHEWPCFEAEWVDLARPNDELIADVYKAAHGGLERSNKLRGNLWEDTYSVLCFIKDNPTPAKCNFEITLQMALIKDKDFKIPFASLAGDATDTRKGKDEMNIDQGLVAWAQKQFDKGVEKYELRDGATDACIEKWNGADTLYGIPLSAHLMAFGLYRSAWYDQALRKNFKACIELKGAGGFETYEFKIDADVAARVMPSQARAGTPPYRTPYRVQDVPYQEVPLGGRGVPLHAAGHFVRSPFMPFQAMKPEKTMMDWLERSWPMIEQAFGVLLENARGKPYSVEMHERFMDIHSAYMAQYFEARQQDKAQKEGIYQALGTVLPAVMSMYMPGQNQTQAQLQDLREKLSSFYLSLEPKQFEALLASMNDDQRKKLLDLLGLVSIGGEPSATAAPTGNTDVRSGDSVPIGRPHRARVQEPWRTPSPDTGTPSAE